MSFNNQNSIPSSFATLTPVPTTFSQPPSNTNPLSPEQDTDGNLFNQTGSTAQMINYWSSRQQMENCQNQGNF